MIYLNWHLVSNQDPLYYKVKKFPTYWLENIGSASSYNQTERPLFILSKNALKARQSPLKAPQKCIKKPFKEIDWFSLKYFQKKSWRNETIKNQKLKKKSYFSRTRKKFKFLFCFLVIFFSNSFPSRKMGLIHVTFLWSLFGLHQHNRFQWRSSLHAFLCVW